jgi:hypothetical protein
MTVVSGQVACPSNAAVQIIAAASNASDASSAGARIQNNRTVMITNPSSQSVYLGGDNTVTSATGYLLVQNGTVSLTLRPNDSVWGRGAQFTPVVHYIESGS